MSYRDGLEAALARIASLEEQLSQASSGDTSALIAETEVLRQQNQELREQLEDQLRTAEHYQTEFAEAIEQAHAESMSVLERASAIDSQLAEKQAMNDALRRELAELQEWRGRALETAPGSGNDVGVTLFDHNRSSPPYTKGIPVRALCPLCITRNERVEMVRTAQPQTAMEGSAIIVMCPRCLYSGMLRQSPT